MRAVASKLNFNWVNVCNLHYFIWQVAWVPLKLTPIPKKLSSWLENSNYTGYHSNDINFVLFLSSRIWSRLIPFVVVVQVPNPPMPGTPCFVNPPLPATVTTQSLPLSLHFIIFFFRSLASSTGKKTIYPASLAFIQVWSRRERILGLCRTVNYWSVGIFFCRGSELHRCRASHPTPCTKSRESTIITITTTTIIRAMACRHLDH